jgi:hypothetical protein
MERLVELTPHATGPERLEMFRALPNRVQEACLRDAADKAAFLAERERQGLELEWWDWPEQLNIHCAVYDRRKAKKPNTPYIPPSTDDLERIEAEVYVQAVTGKALTPTRHGYILCPLPDHSDSSPSCKLYEDSWYCYSCNRGGSIYTFAAHFWGYPVPTRGEQFKELKQRLRRLFA